jgi:GxxExxY protein
VHRQLGPGLLESTYQACLAHELSRAGMRFAVQTFSNATLIFNNL